MCLVTLVYPVVSSSDIDMHTWPRCSEAVPAYRQWISGSKLSKVGAQTGPTDRQTDRQMRPNTYHAAFAGGTRTESSHSSSSSGVQVRTVTSTHINWFWWFLAEMSLKEYAIKWSFYPTSPDWCLCTTLGNMNHKIVLFQSSCIPFLENNSAFGTCCGLCLLGRKSIHCSIASQLAEQSRLCAEQWEEARHRSWTPVALSASVTEKIQFLGYMFPPVMQRH